MGANTTGLQPSEMRMGPANIYLKDGSGGTSVHVGYVGEVKWQATRKSKPVFGGQDGETPVDFFGSGIEFRVSFQLQQISLKNIERAAYGITQGYVDDTDPTKRRLEFKPNLGWSYRGSATELIVKPIINGIETTDKEHILTCPIAAAVGNTVEAMMSATEQSVLPCEFYCFADPANGGRAAYFGDVAAADATAPTGRV
jgi:hypothetical protein